MAHSLRDFFYLQLFDRWIDVSFGTSIYAVNLNRAL